MSITTLFIIVIAALIVILIIVGLIAFVDWRAIIVRHFGPDYKKGLAHIRIEGVWVYRESKLVYEGNDAMTYSRKIGKDRYQDDIVPNAIGFRYDEYEGCRVYRVQPGGSVATSDDGEAPVTDYPSGLLSTHILDRTAVNYASSVNAEGGIDWKKVLIITGLAALVIVAILYFTGALKLPGTPAKTNAPNISPPVTTPAIPTTQPQSGPAGGQ